MSEDAALDRVREQFYAAVTAEAGLGRLPEETAIERLIRVTMLLPGPRISELRNAARAQYNMLVHRLEVEPGPDEVAPCGWCGSGAHSTNECPTCPEYDEGDSHGW